MAYAGECMGDRSKESVVALFPGDRCGWRIGSLNLSKIFPDCLDFVSWPALLKAHSCIQLSLCVALNKLYGNTLTSYYIIGSFLKINHLTVAFSGCGKSVCKSALQIYGCICFTFKVQFLLPLEAFLIAALQSYHMMGSQKSWSWRQVKLFPFTSSFNI